MPVQLTIIGLGQIGTSVGLALAGKKDLILRMGHDKENGNAKLAEKMGALDKTHYNLPASVRDADIVLLSIPFDGIRETLEFIRDDLKEGAVVMDTARSRSGLQWAKQYIPEGRYYVGQICPEPGYIHEMKAGIDATPTCSEGLIGIVAPPGAGRGNQLAGFLPWARADVRREGGGRQPDGQPAPATSAHVRSLDRHDRRSAGMAGSPQAGRQSLRCRDGRFVLPGHFRRLARCRAGGPREHPARAG
jgi:hypothetical protein